jgi:hypothetical protein
MPGISVTPVNAYVDRTERSVRIRHCVLQVTGLASGNNSVPHGLPKAPRVVNIEANSTGPFIEYQAADATYIYINAGGAGTTCNLTVEY